MRPCLQIFSRMNEPGVSAREHSLTSCHKSEFEFVFVVRVSRDQSFTQSQSFFLILSTLALSFFHIFSEHCHFLIYYQDTFTFSAVFSIIKVGHKSESGFSHLRRGFHQLDTPLLLCFDGLVFNSIEPHCIQRFCISSLELGPALFVSCY